MIEAKVKKEIRQKRILNDTEIKAIDKFFQTMEKRGIEPLSYCENEEAVIDLDFTDTEYDVYLLCKFHDEKGNLVLTISIENQPESERTKVFSNNEFLNIEEFVLDYVEDTDPGYSDTDELWENALNSRKRIVYICKNFEDTLKECVKTPKDAERVRNQIVLKWMSLDDEEVDLWLNNKHGVPIICQNGKTIYRKRSPKGSNVAKINRYFVCKGKQLHRKDIGDNDIVLLAYLGEDKHLPQKYESYANVIASKLFDDGQEQDKNEDSEGSNKNEILYKGIVPRSKKKINILPVLDNYQAHCLNDELLISPPRLVYGSAGTGKTLLSQELFEKLVIQNPENKILYLTYMPRLKKQVAEDIKKRNLPENRGEILDLTELYKKYLPKESNHYRGIKEFKKWARGNLHEKNINISKIDDNEELALDFIYIFFRTLSNTESFNSPEVFADVTKEEKGLDADAKEIVRKACLEYEKYLDKERLFSDNKLAKRLQKMVSEKQIEEKYDAIIVDEVQDLTKKQVESIISLLSIKGKTGQFYAFGDDNQAINPSLLRLSSVDELIFTKLGGKNQKRIVLKDSYRSTDYLIQYINYMNKLRQKIIGRDKQYNDEDQRSKISFVEGNESSRPVLINNEDLISQGFNDQDIFSNNNIMIIVPSEKEKKNLLEKFSILQQANSKKVDNVLTIEETKGGEWDTVVLYNFFSSSPDIWQMFTESLDVQDAVKLKSTLYRMYINRYYVGLTRASKKVIIAESDSLDKRVRNYFIPQTDNLNKRVFTEVNDFQEFKSFFENEYTHDVWFNKALGLYEMSDYEMAYDYLGKAIRALESKMHEETQWEKYYDQYSAWRKLANDNQMTESEMEECSAYGFNNNDTQFINSLYKKFKQEEKADLLSKDEDSYPQQVIDDYERINNEEKFTDSERSYFALKAIKAYRNIITKEMEEVKTCQNR